MRAIQSVVEAVVSDVGTSVSGIGSASEVIDWDTRYISALSILTTSETEQTVTPTIIGGYTIASYEVSTDNITFTEHGTSDTGVYLATGLTAGTQYFWRARLYEGSSYSEYSVFDDDTTYPTVLLSGDGKTWAIYDAKNTDSITKNGSDQMSEWSDIGGANHHLLQAGADGIKPVHKYGLYVSTDGVGQFLKTAAATLEQPTTIYIVCRQKGWASAGSFFDGNAANSGRIFQHVTTKNYKAYAGSESALVIYSFINNWDLIRVVFNGASSKIQVNEELATEGNFGAADMGGFTLGCRGDDNYFANIEVKEIIIRAEADATNYTNIGNYLTTRHFDKQFQEAMVSFGFDNGNLSFYERGYPLFVNREQKVTSYLNSGLMGVNDVLGVMDMSWANATAMHDSGYVDVECHGQTHIGFDTLAASTPDLEDELVAQNAAFVTNSIPTPAHTAYPNAEEVTARVTLQMMPYRESARDYLTPSVNNRVYRDTNKLKMMEYHIDKGYMIDINAAYGMIDQAILDKGAIFFTSHDVRAADDDTGGIASIKIDVLTLLLDYAIASGIKIVTHTEIADLMDV